MNGEKIEDGCSEEVVELITPEEILTGKKLN